MSEEELKAIRARWSQPASPGYCYCGHDPCWGCRTVATMEHAREDVPALLAEVRRLRAIGRSLARLTLDPDVSEWHISEIEDAIDAFKVTL